MILFVHMLFGAALGERVHNPYFAIAAALLGHYFLDLFPHVEYSIDNLHRKTWHKAIPDAIKILVDFSAALIMIAFLSNGRPFVYLCAFVAIIPDGLTILNSLIKNRLLQIHTTIHTTHIHYLTKQKKFPLFWRIFTQCTAVLVSILLLRT